MTKLNITSQRIIKSSEHTRGNILNVYPGDQGQHSFPVSQIPTSCLHGVWQVTPWQGGRGHNSKTAKERRGPCSLSLFRYRKRRTAADVIRYLISLQVTCSPPTVSQQASSSRRVTKDADRPHRNAGKRVTMERGDMSGLLCSLPRDLTRVTSLSVTRV